MTREEAIKMLSILKAAYPNSYKGMTKDEANGTINIWAMQFSNMPFNIVAIAVNKLISTNTFPPSINEVKEKIRSLYWEAWTLRQQHEQALDPEWSCGTLLDEKTLALVNEIIRVTEPMRIKEKIEPSLVEILSVQNEYLTADNSDKPLLK